MSVVKIFRMVKNKQTTWKLRSVDTYECMPTLELAKTSPEMPPRTSVRDAIKVPIETRLCGSAPACSAIHEGCDMYDSLWKLQPGGSLSAEDGDITASSCNHGNTQLLSPNLS